MNSLGVKQSFHREKFKGKIKINNPYEYKNRNADEIDTSIYKNPPIKPKSPISAKPKKTNIKVRDNTLKVFEDLNKYILMFYSLENLKQIQQNIEKLYLKHIMKKEQHIQVFLINH